MYLRTKFSNSGLSHLSSHQRRQQEPARPSEAGFLTILTCIFWKTSKFQKVNLLNIIFSYTWRHRFTWSLANIDFGARSYEVTVDSVPVASVLHHLNHKVYSRANANGMSMSIKYFYQHDCVILCVLCERSN